MKLRTIVVVMIAVFTLAACDGIGGSTGDSDNDAAAAQQFFPTLAGFGVYETDNMQDAFTSVAGGAAALANPALILLVERMDSLISCYRDVGALDANIYIQQVDLNNVAIPLAGFLAVINEDRVRSNFLGCISSDPLSGMMRSQAAEPCTGSGTFTAENGDRISYIYAATDVSLCTQFQNHFSQFG